jgi:hypothetical protein
VHRRHDLQRPGGRLPDHRIHFQPERSQLIRAEDKIQE